MGYNHFALISASSDLSSKQFKLVQKVCEKLRDKHKECLFGEVHHLSSGSFGEDWMDQFDDFMLKLYEETSVKSFNLYICEFDGESLVKYQYTKGIKKKGKNIEVKINDDDIISRWMIESL